MNHQFKPLEEGEVISVDGNAQLPLGHHTFRVVELTEAIKKQLEIATSAAGTGKDNLLSDSGVPCEALRFGSTAWQTGRLRLCLEFCPDDGANSHTKSNTEQQSHPANPPVNNVAVTNNTTTGLMSGEGVNHSHQSAHAVVTANPTDNPELLTVESAVMAPAETEHPTPVDVVPAAPMADVVLLTEEETTAVTHDRDLEEIAFDFHDGDVNQGVLANNGSMDLELTDTAIGEDYVSFESDGLPDPSDLSELFSQPENSGLLIDEVWNEMNQPNWPKVAS